MRFALENEYDVLVTIDCDGQHQPHLIPDLVAATRTADVVSGSRYLQPFDGNTSAPADRRAINVQMTTVLNRVLGLQLTDSFCGFKAYRVAPLAKLELTENGYAMPLEFWVRAADHGLTIREYPVPRVYLEEERSFGGALDDSARGTGTAVAAPWHGISRIRAPDRRGAGVGGCAPRHDASGSTMVAIADTA